MKSPRFCNDENLKNGMHEVNKHSVSHILPIIKHAILFYLFCCNMLENLN